MTLAQFSALDEMEQIEVIWPLPAIGERWESGYQVLLFQVDAFYVELYHHIHRDATEKLRAFSDTEHLHVYLEQINIDSLLNSFK